MRRRIGVMLLGLVAVLFAVPDSAWACKFLDGCFSRFRTRRCEVRFCCDPCCPVEPSCCTAVAHEDADAPPAEATKEAPKEAPEEAPGEEPAEEPAVETPEEPAVETPEEPAVETPEEPAVETPEEPAVETPEEPAVETPEEPAVETPDEPAVETPEEDPFSLNDTGGSRRWTDISGKYQVQAKFVSLKDDTVRLKKSNGRYCRIVLEKLSPADRAFLRGQIGSIAKAW